MARTKLFLFYSHFSIVTLDDHMKHFHHGPHEALTDTRLVPLETRRASLPKYYESEASKPEFTLHLLTKQGRLWLKLGHSGMWLVGTSCVCNDWTAGSWTEQ